MQKISKLEIISRDKINGKTPLLGVSKQIHILCEKNNYNIKRIEILDLFEL